MHDYRISTIAVTCNDCGNDVGAYPGLHKCPPRPAMPAMPAIPSRFQQQQPQASSYTPPSSYSTPSSRSNGRRAQADPDLDSARSGGSDNNSYGRSRESNGTSSSRSTAAMSFQERMKEKDREKQQRLREEREIAARALQEEVIMPGPTSTTTAAPAAAAGTTLWSRLRAAKEVINATITGEERWPDSDDSDHEGETHVGRILRELADKKENDELAAKIAELDMTPVGGPSSTGAGEGSLSKASGSSRNQYLRDAVRKEPPASMASSTSSGDDYYGRSLRTRGGDDPNERSWSPSTASVSTNASTNSYNSNSLSASGGREGRYRAPSDANRDDALSRLEGKSQGDKLATQVSHLGSTTPRPYQPQQQLSPSNNYSNPPSQRSVSPGASRQYNSPPQGGSRQPYPGGSPNQQPPGPSYPNNNNGSSRQQPPARGDAYSSRSGGGGNSGDAYSSRSGGSGKSGDAYSSRSGGGGNGGDAYSSRSGGGSSGGARGPDPGYGRSEHDRRPAYPQGNRPPPGGNSNMGGYAQRPQYQQPPQQQRQYAYGSQSQSQGNYF